MPDYVDNISSARIAMDLALKNLERGNLEKVKTYLDEGRKNLDEVMDVRWNACKGVCECCDFEACRGLTEREELEFSKMLKEFAVMRLKRRIEATDARLNAAPPESR